MDGVPPGTYKIKVWHEGIAMPDKTNTAFLVATPFEQDKQVTVAPNGKASTEFNLALQ